MKIKNVIALSVCSCLVYASTFNALPVKALEEETITINDTSDCNPTGSFRVSSKKLIGYSYGEFRQIASNKSGATSNGQTLSASTAKTYSHSVSGTAQITYKAISASLGFDVTSSRTLTATYSVKLNKGQKAKIYARPMYEIHKVSLQRYHSGTNACNFWAKYGTATVRKFVGYDYKVEVTR
jgi:hypothetical protein